MTSIQLPLNEIQLSLLKLTENLKEEELQELKKLIIAYKANRLAMLADQVWDEKGWTEATMQAFLNEHMRTPYKVAPTKLDQ
jgi:hypothetical protein